MYLFINSLLDRTHTHTQSCYGSLDFVQDNPGELVTEETFTHSHLLWSSFIPYLLITIHAIIPVQFTCLTVFFHNLSPSFLWSTSWPGTLRFILHTFLHPIIVFYSQWRQLLSAKNVNMQNKIMSINLIKWHSNDKMTVWLKTRETLRHCFVLHTV